MKMLYATKTTALIILLCGCSTSGPTLSEITEAESEEAQWQKRYEQQCLAAGVKPGTPMMVKCIDDLTEIGAEQPDG